MNTPPDWEHLGAAVEREAQPARARPLFSSARRRRWLVWTSALGLLLLAGLLAGPFSPWPRGPDEAELATGRRAALAITAQALRDYARMHGRYPARVDEALALRLAQDIDYQPGAEGFRLRLSTPGGQMLTIESR